MPYEEATEPAPSPVLSGHPLTADVSELNELADEVRGTLQREIFFGLVRTIGSDPVAIIQTLEASVKACGYDFVHIRLSGSLTASHDESLSEMQRYRKLMDDGDELRQTKERGDAVAVLAFRKVIEERSKHSRPTAFLFDNLVHPAEIATLRGVYGRRLFVIACDAPRHERHMSLRARFKRRTGLSDASADLEALRAINRNAGLEESAETAERQDDATHVKSKYRLCVGKCLERSDVFVRSDDPKSAQEVTRKLVECIQSHPFHTPTTDELGMAVAFQAALGTATLSRRVGATIMVDGNIVATGANEVPKTGGGIYTAESEPDAREWIVGHDPSDPTRAQILADLILKLRTDGWLKDENADQSIRSLTERAINDPHVSQAEIFDIIEYGRSTHAEMVAIAAAARLGISISGATLYTTTLPCHECTRNIIPTGIARVVYLEAYPKSRGAELQAQSIAMVAHHGKALGKLSFEPFCGFSYRRFSELFSWVDRKLDDVHRAEGNPLTFDGQAVIWKASESTVRESILNPDFEQIEFLVQRYRERALVREVFPE